MAEKSKKNEAYVQFAKLQRAEDAKKATSEYETTAASLRAKTERLRALRLERAAAAAETASKTAHAPKRKSKSKGSGSSLSDFLDGQAKEGRNG